jgi:transposase
MYIYTMEIKRLDGRKLDHKTLEAIRIRAVQSVQSGQSPEHVIAALGMTRAIIYRWLAAFNAGGLQALQAKKLFGRPPKLSATSVRWIYRTVIGKNPLQLKFEFALWTREMIRDLIKQQFGISMSVVSVGRLLARLGLTCQRPLFRAYQQNADAVNNWMEHEFPRLAQKAKNERASVFFADEAGIRSDYHAGTTWAPRGQTPKVQTTGARFGLNMISAITRKGEMRFMVIDKTVKADIFCEFIDRLMHNRRNKVYLIVDGHPVHRSTKVAKHVASYQGRIQLVRFPSYSPETNPDELVWNSVKPKIGRSFVAGPDMLKSKVVGALRWLQKSPRIIKAFFNHPELSYIAC